jgi:hypothetical protein
MAELYPPTAPVQGINQGLFPAAVNAEFFRQYIQLTPLWNLMGEEFNRPIVRHKMKAGEGWQYTVGKLDALDFTKPVLNFDQVSGSGQRPNVESCPVQCNKISFLRDMVGRDLLELGTPLNIPDTIRPQLIEVCQRNFNKCILDSAMFDYMDPTNTAGGYNPATQKPSYDRVALAGIHPGGSATQDDTDRQDYYLFAGIKTAWNNMSTGTAYNQNGLSADHLLKLKALAGDGGYAGGAVYNKGTIEDAIRPAYLKSRGGWPINEYIYLANTASLAQLYKDPQFNQSTISRGTVISADQPEAISGADYIGKFYGIHIYEVRDLSRYISYSANGNYRIAWELFIGAGAWSAGWFKEPYITYKNDVTNSLEEFTSHEIRGERALKFKAKQPRTIDKGILVEQGIIHSFVRLD